MGLETYVSEYTEAGYDVVGFGVDRRQNAFFIRFNENDRSSIDLSEKSVVSNIYKDLPILIEFGSPLTTCATELKGGMRIDNTTSQVSATLGICGTYDGSLAILTCGHGNREGDTIKYNGTTIGTVNYRRANFIQGYTGINSWGDFSIVKISASSTFTTTNKVMRTASIFRNITSYYTGSIPVGTTVYKYGSTDLYGVGVVQRVMANFSAPDAAFPHETMYTRYLDEVLMSGGYAADGDSGGPVYTANGSSYKLSGTITARSVNTNLDYEFMYVTPIYLAVNAGFTPKTTS